MMTVSRKITFVGYKVNCSCFCHRAPFLPEWMTDRQNHGIQSRIFGRHFLEKEWSVPVTYFKEHNWQHLFPVINLKLSSQKLKLQRTCNCHALDSVPIIKGFSAEISCDVNKCDDFLKISYNEMCQYLEDLHNSVNQYFPNDQFTMLQNHAWVKEPFKVQDKWVDFNVIECEKLYIKYKKIAHFYQASHERYLQKHQQCTLLTIYLFLEVQFFEKCYLCS